MMTFRPVVIVMGLEAVVRITVSDSFISSETANFPSNQVGGLLKWRKLT